MPGYRTHDRIGYIAVAPLTLCILYIYNIYFALLFGAFFLISNRYLSPDLDIDSIMIQRWGVLYFIWYPYKKLIHHRSLFSHSGPISALIRLLYLSLWIIGIATVCNSFSLLYYSFLHYTYVYAIFYLACSCADLLHTVFDFL